MLRKSLYPACGFITYRPAAGVKPEAFLAVGALQTYSQKKSSHARVWNLAVPR